MMGNYLNYSTDCRKTGKQRISIATVTEPLRSVQYKLKGLWAVYQLSLTNTDVPAVTSELVNRLFHVLSKDYFISYTKYHNST